MDKQTSATPCYCRPELSPSLERHERRTRLVVGLTAVTMVGEIAAGWVFGSMALLADGWHMASHAVALSITTLGYYLARRHAGDPRFTFGTGKIGELAGFASALLLAATALVMIYESLLRLVSPVAIAYGEAILVATLGLLVNLASAFWLREGHDHHHGHDDDSACAPSDHDHNLRSAYLHVLADALTSVLAIGALLAGSLWGAAWLDPMMGLVGGSLIARWSWGLLRDTGRVLLDLSPDLNLAGRIKDILEDEGGARVLDLHVWRLGPGRMAAIVALSADQPRPLEYYKSLLARHDELCHLTLEVNLAV